MVYTGGPYIQLTEANIKSKGVSPYVIKPINMPFQRTTDALEQIRKAAFDSSYVPWEWWIEKSNGEIKFDSRRGTDKSGTVSFVAVNVSDPNEVHLGKTSRSEDIRKTAQRVRVTGKAEGKRQDEVSSNWQEDTTAMNTINSFYEEIISERNLSNRETANAWANIYLGERKDPIQEIEVTIERDPYDHSVAATDWGVGDDVTIYDPKSRITSGSYRIHKVTYSIDSSGEHITLTVTNSWQDVTDSIADLYRKIKVLEMSNIVVEDWSSEIEDGEIDAEKLDNVWKITRKYEDNHPIQEVPNADNAESYDTCPVALPDVGRDVICKKDELSIYGQDATGAAQLGTVIYTIVTNTNWKYEPRFKVKMLIETDFLVAGDHVIFGIYAEDLSGSCIFNIGGNMRGFGFKVVYTGSGSYTVYANLMDGSTNEKNKKIAIISADELHSFEVQTHWDNQYAIYYMDEKPKAIILFNKISSTLRLMYIELLSNDHAEADTDIVQFYEWTTQALRKSKEE